MTARELRQGTAPLITHSTTFLGLLMMIPKGNDYDQGITNAVINVPEMARSIFLRAPNVVMPSSFRSWSVRVRNVWRSICRGHTGTTVTPRLPCLHVTYSIHKTQGHSVKATVVTTWMSEGQMCSLMCRESMQKIQFEIGFML